MTDAIALARHLRHEREQMIAALRSGAATIGGLPAAADGVKVVVLAEAVPGVGKVAARRLLDDLAIPHAQRWGELGPRRAELVSVLSEAAAGGASPASGP